MPESAERAQGRPLEPGEAYYRENGWSGCAGSDWSRLPPAAKDGWAHAERLVAGLRLRQAEAWHEGYQQCRTDDRNTARTLIVHRTPNPYRNHQSSPEPCIAPPGNLCTDTGCWDMDRCVRSTPGADQ